MSKTAALPLTGRLRTFAPEQLIVTKTDTTGRITYANQTFVDISGYTEDELLGQPHSMIRHPHMPRAVFKLMWDRIGDGCEIFAFVCNRSKNGDHYWVLAHITPNVDETGKIVGYHSSRRTMSDEARKTVEPLYARLHAMETEGADRKAALARSSELLASEIERLGFASYDRFVLHHGR